MTLGITDGTNDFGLSGYQSGLTGFNSDYGTSIGTTRGGSGYYPDGKTIGVTTDSTKSGITVERNNSKHLHFFVN